MFHVTIRVWINTTWVPSVLFKSVWERPKSVYYRLKRLHLSILLLYIGSLAMKVETRFLILNKFKCRFEARDLHDQAVDTDCQICNIILWCDEITAQILYHNFPGILSQCQTVCIIKSILITRGTSVCSSNW